MAPSRVTTSIDGGQKKEKQGGSSQDGINITPESGPSGDLNGSRSSAKQDKPSSSSVISSAITPTFSQTALSTPSITIPTNVAATTTAQTNQNQDGDGESSLTPRLPNPSKNLAAGQLAANYVSSQQSKSRVSASSTASAPAAQGNSGANSGQGQLDNGAAMSAFQRARGSQTSSAVPPTTPQSQAGMPSSTQEFTPKVALANPSNSAATSMTTTWSTAGGEVSISTVSISENAKASIAQSPTTSSASPTASIFGQVPAAFLGDGKVPVSAPSGSPSPQSTSKTVQYPYPDASMGASQMAQGYNSIFEGLDPLSPCDPNNKKHASACVRGQPAKCELDGTYSLISCDQGESCYAVPKANGQGVDIGCYNPQAAKQAISAGSSSNNGQQASQTISAASGSGTLRPNGQGNANQGFASSNAGASVASSATAASETQSASASPVALANIVSSSSTGGDVIEQSPGAAAGNFPQPKATVESSTKAPTSSALQTPSTSRSSQENAEQGGFPAKEHNQSGASKQNANNNDETSSRGDQPQSDQDQGSGRQSKQQDGSQSASNNNKNESASSSSKNSDSSKSSSRANEADNKNSDSGVQLSFPGSGGKPANSDHDSSSKDKSEKNKSSPETNQKNAVAAKVVSPSMPLPTSTSTPGGDAPTTTSAPTQPDGRAKGFITVTVTKTITERS